MSMLRVDYMFFWVGMDTCLDIVSMLMSMLRCGSVYREGRCTCSSVYREEYMEGRDLDAGGVPLEGLVWPAQKRSRLAPLLIGLN